MRKLLLILAGIIGAAVFAASATSAPAGASDPAIRLTATHPLTVRGTGFVGRERLRVTAVAGDQREVHAVRASRRGTFETRFDDIAYERCAGLSLRVVRKLGSSVALHRAPTMCAPAGPQPTP